ncbi:MAG: hypothetical protein ABEK50_16830 [bacterium]
MKPFFIRSLREGYTHSTPWILAVVLWGVVLVPLGIQKLGVIHSTVGRVSLQMVLMAVLLPLIVPVFPVFRRAARSENGEESFLRIQIQPTTFQQFGEWLGEIVYPLLAVTSAFILDVSIQVIREQEMVPIVMLWTATMVMVLILSAVGTFLGKLVNDRFYGLMCLGGSWLAMVFLYDVLVGGLLLLDPPDSLIRALVTLNPVDLYRMSLYQFLPSLGPASREMLLGPGWIVTGLVLWFGVFFPLTLRTKNSIL